jgi:serine/threonine protein kinase
MGAEVGGYTLTESLGAGGLGLVFLGTRNEEQAAIKLGRDHGGSLFMTRLLGASHARGLRGTELSSFSADDVDAVLRGEADVLELAAGAAGLPRLLGRIEHEGRPVLILERVPGRSLLARRAAGEALPLAPVSALARALATAIRAESLSAHGELKLGNLILDDEGLLRPIDPRPCGEPSVASPGYSPLLRHDPSADAVALAGCLQAYASGSEPFGTDAAPARARDGDRVSLMGFLALHPAPEVSAPLSELLPGFLNADALLAAPAVERLEQLADAIDALELDSIPAPALATPPGVPGLPPL